MLSFFEDVFIDQWLCFAPYPQSMV